MSLVLGIIAIDVLAVVTTNPLNNAEIKARPTRASGRSAALHSAITFSCGLPTRPQQILDVPPGHLLVAADFQISTSESEPET